MAKPKLQPFTEKEVKQAKFLVGNGFTMEKLALFFGMSDDTLERKLKITPGGKAGILQGRSELEGAVLQTTFEMIQSKKFPILNMFWLRTRAHWRDRNPKDENPTIVINNNIPSESESDKINKLREQHLALLKKEKECSQILSSVPLSLQDSAPLPSVSPGESSKPK